jgi:putative endonuclease
MTNHNYFVYITTNPQKTVLYVGATNDLETRMVQHFQERGNPKIYTGKYFCYNLVYFEHLSDINQAIEREKERNSRLEKIKKD